MASKKILIAGGTGLIGKQLVAKLMDLGHQVNILTRSTNPKKNHFTWDPQKQTIDLKAFEDVEVIINLVGEGIADKRWTTKRKKLLLDSRVGPTEFLYSFLPQLPLLSHYIAASGINCYGYKNYDRSHPEEDPFGTDFLSQVVQKWEEASDKFISVCKVSKVRTSIVLSKEGGALATIAKTIRFYLGSSLGTGKQWVPWITMDDMIDAYIHIMNQELEGPINTLAGNVTNKEFTKCIAKTLGKPLILPNAPSFMMKILLGEMSSIVLDGLQADNNKLISSGFRFKHDDLETALRDVLK